MFLKCIVHCDHSFEKITLDKINGTKNALGFLLCASNLPTFIFNLRFLYELKHKTYLKLSKKIFHCLFRFVFIKICIFFLTKCMESLTLKHHNSFQNYNNRKATHIFATKHLILKLQQEVLKFNDTCVLSWSSPKLTW